MASDTFRLLLYLPAGGASETEATILEWHVAEGDEFQQGQPLAQIDSAKSVFEYESPCAGKVIRILHPAGATVPLTEAILEIETADAKMKDWIPPVAAASQAEIRPQTAAASANSAEKAAGVSILGVGGYLPERVVTNGELLKNIPELSDDYVFQVTGIRERRWAAPDEKPSTMALAASLEAIRKSKIAVKDIDAIVLATTTPDAAMPSTACILADRLGLPDVPAFDLNAACSGWLYAVGMARGMIVSGLARNVLAVGVDMQSRLLEPSDRSAIFLFGDGAGAGVVSAASTGHRIRQIILGANTQGLQLARREEPGYQVLDGRSNFDPWIRIDGQSLFRYAVDSFSRLIRDAISLTGWPAGELPWIVPHQANGRILKAAAKRSGVPFERFFLNVERVGNISSASIPVLLTEAEPHLKPNDKLVLCSVGAGLTTAAITVEW
ncbi:MAG: beta-ketoacyl-ACP synthase 3 [Pirellulales bacterium]|nr:beta-ketoacyl-ACP synthase 3 [Pirellulales bacterium]